MSSLVTVRVVALALAGAVLGGIAGRLAGPLPIGPVPPQDLAVAGPTLDGTTIDVHDLRGKVVLIDCWATWCPPCREELPNVRALYERYHSAGFEVVGVCLDSKQDRLASFVREHKLPWPQIIFSQPEQQGWQNPIVRQLGVHAIPATFLLDRQGKLVGQELFGRDLEKAVARLIEKDGFPQDLQATAGISLTLPGALLGLLAGLFLGTLLPLGGAPPAAKGPPPGEPA
jgi:peroxiredoxin